MKKLLIALSVTALFICSAQAKDYAKMQIKEMKHAQKYNTTQKVLQHKNYNISPNVNYNMNIKDPKILQLVNYDKIPQESYNKKLKADEQKYAEYEKILGKSASKHYKTQAEAADFYKVYRVAEKLIRANKLDYINWRIEIYKDSVSVNAYTTNTNYIALSTSLIDTFGDNENAMALVIGHEMGHALLGHQERTSKTINQMNRQAPFVMQGSGTAALIYAGLQKKYLIDSKNMEYAADVEGAKLAMHAGYNLDSASEVMSYFSSLPRVADWQSDHPDPVKRLQNLKDNAKYFIDEWNEVGKTNIYNSEPMPAKLSSDRKSMVISAPVEKLDTNQYYKPETMNEIYLRFGYKSYVNGEFGQAVKYFNDLFKIDTSNAAAYLYASYANEYLYKNTGENKYLKSAKEFAEKASNLEPDNKYIKEQVQAL